ERPREATERAETEISATFGIEQKLDPASEAVVQVELDRMRRHLHALDLLLLQRDIAVDQLVAEHVALLQELAVAVERLERLLQREANGRDLLLLLRRQVVQIL